MSSGSDMSCSVNSRLVPTLAPRPTPMPVDALSVPPMLRVSVRW